MKRSFYSIFFLALFFTVKSFAQDISTPVGYLESLSVKVSTATQIHMNYLSAVSHGKSARKVEKLRQKVLEGLTNARYDAMGTPPYKGDKTLRDATTEYFKTCYIVFNEDYGKIVNMEEIAEQSYDAMEAYMLAQEKANEKLEAAADKRTKAFHEFARKYDIKIQDGESELGKKVEVANKVNQYYKPLFLLFFKCNKQDAYLTEAINKNDINAVEQNKNALLNYATAGLEQLEAIPAFQSDAGVKTALQRLLQFYKKMTERQIEPVTSFLLAKDNFDKVKKNMDIKPAAQRTQTDVDNYNKAAGDMNKNINSFNKSNNEINKERTELINQWNSVVNRFFDTYMPYAK